MNVLARLSQPDSFSDRQRFLFQVFVAALGLLVILLGFGTVALVHAAEVNAAAPNRAGVIVMNGNGKITKRCVEFTDDTISGLDVLEQSGLDVVVDASNAMGVAVCKIGHEGCDFPGQACFCQCQGASCVYWSYWHRKNNTWVYSNLGASNSTIHNGDIEGWVWGAGSGNAQPPPDISFDDVCAADTAGPTPTNTAVPPTATTEPTATDIPPTQTALPTATDIPPTITVLPTATDIPPTQTPVPPTATGLPTEIVQPTQTAAPTQTPIPPTATVLATATEIPATTGADSASEQATPDNTTPTASKKKPTRVAEISTETPDPPTTAPTEASPAVIETIVPRTATRVAVAQAQSVKPTRAASTTSNSNRPTGLDTRLVSGIILAGGFFVGGCGLVLLLGGMGWYLLRRRGY